MGQKRAKKWAKTAQKMVTIKKNDCHHFFGSKLHNIMVLAVPTRCFKNMGQKWAKNEPKRGLKMAKFQKKNCHRFSGSKLPKKMVLVIFTQCLVPEL